MARITFDCSPETKEAIEQLAKQDRRSMSTWILMRLEEALEPLDIHRLDKRKKKT